MVFKHEEAYLETSWMVTSRSNWILLRSLHKVQLPRLGPSPNPCQATGLVL